MHVYFHNAVSPLVHVSTVGGVTKYSALQCCETLHCFINYLCLLIIRVKENIVETISFRFMLHFILHSICLLLEWVGYVHLANNQNINTICMF